jgi:hypothetical protein
MSVFTGGSTPTFVAVVQPQSATATAAVSNGSRGIITVLYRNGSLRKTSRGFFVR